MTAPLAGIRVVELSQALSGPVAARILGDMGAEVIKVEPPGVGEASRRMGTSYSAGESYYYMICNRNKRGVTLDLRSDEGREVFYRLVGVSDVVLENFRPGVMARLGADYDTLRRRNPAIILCSISGFGQDGPYSDRPAFDSVVQALSGAMSVTGEPDGGPAVMGFAVTDIGGAYGGALSIMGALLARERTGRGAHLDLSLLDIQLTFQGHLSEAYLGGGNVPGRGGSVQSANLPNGAFRTSDGKFLQIHCATQRFYDILAERLARHVDGFEGLPADQRFATMEGRRSNWGDLRALLEKAFATRTAIQWMEMLATELPIAPVNTIAEVFEDPQVVHRGMVVEADHPLVGRYRMPGNPFKMGQEEGSVVTPAPTLGEHNGDVLGGLLGYSAGKISQLEKAGVI